ncbi:BatD family protein [Sulfurimonas sp. MAG313]|nr:hypothetical protein [Sulfurimonas sp. MAG313]MDF1881136.1 BatD family protein [Sulfurimonas sp. MAG313]
MKNILGSLVVLVLSLFAKSEYEWKIDLKETQLYTHQATVLTMQCKFSKEGKNDDVEFTPPTDIPFSFQLLSEKRHFDGELQTLSYKYLVFAKKEGSYEIELKPVMLFTTQSAIDNVIEGRDNVNDLEVQREETHLEPIPVHVSKTSSSLTGTLSLRTELDSNEVSAYEPVHLEISIEGKGNLQSLSEFNFEIEGVQVFADTMDAKFELSKSGFIGVWTQRFAFVCTKDFIIPSVEFKYFDLEDKQEKVLKTQSFRIHIKEQGIQREDLIDKVNLPTNTIDFYRYAEYLYYVLTFLAGFIVAKLVKLPSRQDPQFKKGDKIKKTKNEKELLEVLIICDRVLFKLEIEELERAVYQAEDISFYTLKKRALEKL